MARPYTKEYLKELREQYRLHELVAEVVELRPVGRGDFVGRCPFHDERTGSFRVNDHRYICFGCQERGDVIDWTMHHGRMGFQEAVKFLSEGAVGGAVREATTSSTWGEGPTRSLPAEIIYRINGAAQLHFSSNIYDERSDDIGLDSKDLPGFLLSCGYSADEGVLAGLLNTAGNSRYWGRITIAVRNSKGDICGFIGRRPSSWDDKSPKYICPPASEAWQGKKMLFGIDKVPEKALVTIVEGAFDAIALKYAVATLGAHLTPEQVDIILSKKPKSIRICYDGDPAGARGALEAICLLADKTTVDLFVSFCPPDKDPQDVGDKIQNLPSLPAKYLLTNNGIVMTQENPALLDTLAKPFVDDNLKAGYAHYNVVDWVLQAHPEHAEEIQRTRDVMIKDPSEANIQAFIRAWKKPCKDIRELHGKLEAKRS